MKSLKLYLDSADMGEISEVAMSEYVYGITTNPVSIKKQGIVDERAYINKILTIIPGKEIHLEAMGPFHEIINKIQTYKSSYNSDGFVYKIPCNKEGIIAANVVTTEHKVRTNLHLVYSVSQALLAAKNRSAYICPLMGKFQDEGNDPVKLLSDIREVYDRYDIKTEIIASSIRSVEHVEQALKVGVDGITVPYKIWKEMHTHPLTTKGINLFK